MLPARTKTTVPGSPPGGLGNPRGAAPAPAPAPARGESAPSGPLQSGLGARRSTVLPGTARFNTSPLPLQSRRRDLPGAPAPRLRDTPLEEPAPPCHAPPRPAGRGRGGLAPGTAPPGQRVSGAAHRHRALQPCTLHSPPSPRVLQKLSSSPRRPRQPLGISQLWRVS